MSSATGEADKLSSLTSAQAYHRFSFAEIQSATYDFDDELVVGRGGFGKVYKGRICIKETSHVVAIKRLDSTSDQGAPEFRTEIEMLSKLRHCHLVSLIGFCDDHKEMILVYEYMPHGTLYDHLHKADTPLTWVQRLNIAIGSGRGLDYLHTGVGTQHGVIHRDVKSSNILLDENWAARISDFGLSKVGPINQSSSYIDASVKGTFGYLDPEYFYTRKLTRKTDVFAFGVLLFELLSGRLAVDERFGEEQSSLVRWAKKCVKDRKLYQMVDSSISGTILPNCLRRFAQIANRCLYSVPKERPSMTEVVASLQALMELQGKHDDSAESSGIMGFPWKIHNIFVSTSKQNSDHGDMLHQHGELVVDGDLKKFTYNEVKRATRNFRKDRCLFYGRDVEVYKGWVNKTTYSPSSGDTGLPVAIKRLHRYEHLDLEMLKVFSHPNLVKLLGYGLERQQLFLVYEFMPNGNFEDALRSGALSKLPWVTKVKMAVGIARGIVFYLKTQDEIRADPSQRRTVSESWLDRQKILLDEGLGEELSGYNTMGGDDNDDDYCYDPWSQSFKLQSKTSETYPWKLTVSGSRLDRRKILLDEDFTPKLSDYEDITLAYSGDRREDWIINPHLHHGDYYPGFEPPLRRYLPSFTVVCAELLRGKKFSNRTDFRNFTDFWSIRPRSRPSPRRSDCLPESLVLFAKSCFEACNEVDSDSKMLTIFNEFASGFE